MFSVISTHNRTSIGINFYLSDTFAELDNIKARPGCKAYVIEEGITYILNNAGEWKEYYSSIKKYVDEKLEAVDPVVVEELKKLLEELESGAIDEKITNEVEEQLNSANTQAIIINNVKNDPNIITIEKLEDYNYITEDDLEKIIFNGGTASSI